MSATPSGTAEQAVLVTEVGLRDGLQSIARTMSTAAKLQWLDTVYGAGVRSMEVASYVPPRLLPQMADADAVVERALQLPGLTVTVLVPNAKGAERALAAGAHRIVAPLSVSEAHSQANVRRSRDAMVDTLREICALRDASGKPARIIGGLSTAFGCTLQGEVPIADVVEYASRALQAGADTVALADTTGLATPALVDATLQAVRAAVGERCNAVHFHDTRGMALANTLVALRHGIREFDASLGGIGGCPHAPGASGNVAAEDLVFMLESMGLSTGIDVRALIDARSVITDALPGESLFGSIARAGVPSYYRAACADVANISGAAAAMESV
ncbi:hydroxymethylglutaryl-CoA lyase [Chitinasiproducens palmae]|uniref:Hydroxymethylglutaryl-CoA lyase n=1 Tax=Chitinasiproducens palmae TaxID=1770053 RepID=A0A1H2PR14_9BURK|nr:hydroxymethylglutaryl-CoA lyase [Chitinasiproducens palmae]SDV48879.1 hydroxymethylglutaryl-CoA lyase [Chitinasiproducens palmae]